MKKMHTSAAAAALFCAASFALAAPVLDGTRDAQYGPAKALQLAGTNFGNSTNSTVETASGSELDGAYGFVENGNLHLFLSGNLETNFNKLEIFIDSRTGGQNKLRGDNPNVDFNGLNRMGDDGSGNGLTFDSGFVSDFYLTTTGGGNPSTEFFATFSETNTTGGGNGRFIGGSGTASSPRVVTGTPGGVGEGIVIAYNNSNVGGVGEFPAGPTADAANVMTGIELLIPLSQIGNPTGDIGIVAFVNGGGHDFVSNQFLGSLPSTQGNLGEPRGVVLSGIAGNQFFTVAVPEPTTLGLAACGMALALVRRRK